LLVRKSDFHPWRDDITAAQKECYQTGISAFPLFTNCIIPWFAAMIEQLKAPRAHVLLPGCAINEQIVVENKLTLCQAVIQRVHDSRPISFDRADVNRQQLATRDLIHCNTPLSNFLYAAI
jgi:hypothetical protein